MKIAPEDLYQRLLEVSMHRKIDHIDLYGGEIGILPQSYLTEIQDVIKYFYTDPISIISNLKVVNPYFRSPNIDLSVSWDYLGRESFKTVYENMKTLERPFHILVLASRKVIDFTNKELEQMWLLLADLPNLASLEIKPYSKNKHHSQDVSYNEYENWVMTWIQNSPRFKFEFINQKKIEQCLSQNISSWSDDHLYITPNGKFAVLEFDESHNEFFMPLETIADYFSWTLQEKSKIGSNDFCSNCDYLGHCLSEHLQDVKNLDKSCNGFKNLLTWYKNERAQT